MSEAAEDQDLLIEKRGAAMWLTIHREERRNAMSPAVLAGMPGKGAPHSSRDAPNWPGK